MCFNLFSLESLLLAFVMAGHGNLKADREVLSCDDIVRTAVGAVLAAYLTPRTANRQMFPHGTTSYFFTTSRQMGGAL